MTCPSRLIILHAFFTPLAGGDNLFTINGPQWKRSRELFNSGFSASHVLQQASHIVDEAEIYVEILRGHAKREQMFSLDDITCWYLMDVIGTVTLDTRLYSQRQFNPLASVLRRQIRWHVLDNEWNVPLRWNPARYFVQLQNNWQMNSYIVKELDKRYAEWTEDEADASPRSIIHLALAGYMIDQENRPKPKRLDPAFKAWATAQIRLFIFVGHDSASSTICYCFYLLQSHPDAMAKLRAEHDAIFGLDIAKAADQIRERPHLLNQMPYTTAIIKETLRLLPPASAMRDGRPGVDLKDDEGNTYPTEGTNLWILHSAVQRNTRNWPAAKDFLPERWLVQPGNPLYPVKGGWRPFEHGPRNCLGQTLVMLDVKVTLVLTAREFNIHHAYDEWDSLHPTIKVKQVNGERAYQTQKGGAHPVDGYPCRVSVRK